EGARRGERVLYITLSESERGLRLVARRHGWDLSGVEIVELVPSETMLDQSQEITLLHPAELELGETTRLILERVEEINPSRMVIDSLSELRLLAQNSLRYRRSEERRVGKASMARMGTGARENERGVDS